MNHTDWSRRNSNQKANLGQFHTKSEEKLWSLICYLFSVLSEMCYYTAASRNETAQML